MAVIQLRLLPLLVLEKLILLARQETGAVLVNVGEFTVAQNFGVGVVDLQGTEQGDEGSALLGGTGVGRAPMLV